MSSDRSNANIWWYLFKHPKWLNPIQIKRILKSNYFLQDSFKTHWNRIFRCKHKNIKKIDRDNNEQVNFCFNCYREINNIK